MRTSILSLLNVLLVYFAVAGCVSTLDRVAAARSDGGAIQIINHDYDVVFPAAIRVTHLYNESIEEANQETGRIVSSYWFGARAIFLTKLPQNRTRVELSSSMSRTMGIFPWNTNSFFTLLREQIVIFEKKRVRHKLLEEKKKVDQDLRTIYKPRDLQKKEDLPVVEPPSNPTRRERLRLRR